MGGIVAALNPLAAVGGLVGDLIKAHKLNEWAKLLVSLGFSGMVSFLTICGGALAVHRPNAEAVGLGMLAAAAMMGKTWRFNPLTRGTVIALPAEEAKQELEADSQVISR